MHTSRERAGKGASRDLRRNGRVPAVVYGGNEEPLMIHVEEKLLMKQLTSVPLKLYTLYFILYPLAAAAQAAGRLQPLG